MPENPGDSSYFGPLTGQRPRSILDPISGIDYQPGIDFVGVPTSPVINPITQQMETGQGYIGPSPSFTIGGSGLGPYATDQFVLT